MTTTIDMIKTLFLSTLLEKRLKTLDSSSMRKIGQIMNTKLRLDQLEIKLAGGNKNVSLSKERFPLSLIKLML